MLISCTFMWTHPISQSLKAIIYSLMTFDLPSLHRVLTETHAQNHTIVPRAHYVIRVALYPSSRINFFFRYTCIVILHEILVATYVAIMCLSIIIIETQ